MAGGKFDAWVEPIATLLVAFVAVGVAGEMFAAYAAHPDALWRGIYHDRNGHLLAGMNFALAVKSADPAAFLRQLLAMNIWGPVHGLVLAAVFLVGGVDHRLAILPSLLGWTMTVVFGCLTARALFVDRVTGLFAGALAAVWILASPAFRLLASDVMLEGLGAGLSAVALWSYQRARAEPANSARWRWLAIVLTLLFFEKANYWGLVVAALIVNEALARAANWPAWLAGAFERLRSSGRRLLADPWLLAFLAVSALTLGLYVRGPGAIELFGHPVSLYPPDNLATLAYALLFARLWLAWRAHRSALRERLGPAGRSLFYWHAAPLAVTFLIPRRLAAFLWFVGPANSHAREGYDLVGGVLLYGRSFVEAFSAAPWAAALAVALALVGVTQWRRFPLGGRAVFVLAAIGTLGVVLHPQHQPRFLTSWLFAVWICAGAGGGILLDRLTRRSPPWLRPAIGLVCAGGLAVASFDPWPAAAAYAAAIRTRSGPSDLGLVRPWLGAVAGVRIVGVATTFGPSDLFTWAMEERCQCQLTVERPWTSPTGSRDDDRRAMLAAVSASKADRWVLIDAPASPYAFAALGFTYDRLEGVADAMAAQSRFKQVGAWPLPDEGAVARVYAPAR